MKKLAVRLGSTALIAAISAGLARVVVFPGATHNDIGGFPAYWPAIQDFLALQMR
jgi:hypothetical protein